MTHHEIRKKFLEFFEKRGHKIVPSSSLIPEDKSVLFTTAGMQQFKKYYINPEMAPAKNIASIQKCMRTSDIDEVGDETHLTFFEMLGNFSFGGYKKEKAIILALEFLINKDEGMGLEHERISATYYSGSRFSGPDVESKSILLNQSFIKGKVKDKDDNVWGPTGNEGPCGPTVEFYVDRIEVWNLVFNEFYCNPDGSFRPLKQLGVDTGMGLERLAMVVQNKKNIYETDLLEPIIDKIKTEINNPLGVERSHRIIADHLRASIFLISDGLKPSNKDQGYVLRRFIRRATMHAMIRDNYRYPFMAIFDTIVDIYKNIYQDLDTKRQQIETTLFEEVKRFSSRIKEGEEQYFKFGKKISGKEAFLLQQSYGFPIELVRELAKRDGKEIDETGFEKEISEHQEISRIGAEKKFGLK